MLKTPKLNQGQLNMLKESNVISISNGKNLKSINIWIHKRYFSQSLVISRQVKYITVQMHIFLRKSKWPFIWVWKNPSKKYFSFWEHSPLHRGTANICYYQNQEIQICLVLFSHIWKESEQKKQSCKLLSGRKHMKTSG